MIEKTDGNKRIDDLTRKALQLDDICSSIYVILLGRKRLRFNELHRSLRKLGTNISKPTLSDHLKHLNKQKLIKRKVQGVQNVTYSLNEEAMSLFKDSENVSKWIKDLEDSGLCERFNTKEYYKKLTEKELDRKINRALKTVLLVNLHELRAVVNYDLKIKENETDTEFWKFIGNPLYRMYERIVAEDCRESIEYRKKFFEKIDLLIKKLEGEIKDGKS